MRIIHRVGFRYSADLVEAIVDIEIEYDRTPEKDRYLVDLVWFDIDEADPRWPAVKALLNEYGAAPTCIRTEFTTAELRSAHWLEMWSDWHHGYPMPDSDSGYRELTYDLTDYCEKCGMGASQKAPFRMRAEPKWGRRSVMQLNWVFDEVFVQPEVWHTFFAPFGIECKPVLAHKKETKLTTVVQLRFDTILDSELDMKEHPFDICEFCQRKKYLPFSRGMFPAMTKPVKGLHAVKSKEWFGSGASANRAVLVSANLARPLLEGRIKGVRFTPLANPGT